MKNPRQIAIFGATSAIAQETAKLWAAEGHQLFLCGRDSQKLTAMADDLKLKGAHIIVKQANLDITDAHPQLWQELITQLPSLDMVLIAQGLLGDAEACRRSWQPAMTLVQTNFISVCSLATLAGNWFETKGRGCIGVISSVAGDRGRQSNYVYGATKAGLNAFLSGLRNRLFHAGVAVVTIKPGFVSTPMTAHLKQGLLFASPQKVATGIVKAMYKGRSIVYLPRFWQFIMLVFRLMPEWLFKRLKT